MPVGVWYSCFWVGFHFSRNHPHRYALWREHELEELVRWYVAQPHLPLKDRYEEMDDEEVVEEVLNIMHSEQDAEHILFGEDE